MQQSYPQIRGFKAGEILKIKENRVIRRDFRGCVVKPRVIIYLNRETVV